MISFYNMIHFIYAHNIIYLIKLCFEIGVVSFSLVLISFPTCLTEESTVLVESREGSKARSLTLEEATDAILFCSSIVHDMAYQAVTIAMEKESSVPVEGSRPTVTILGKSSSDRKNQRGRTVGKHTSKSQKARQRRVETNAKPPSSETENDENADESMIRNVGLPNKVDSMKPPKLESKCNCTIM